MAIAYPFVQVKVDTSGLTPIATRAPGVVAIVGVSLTGAVGLGVPTPVDDVAAAKTAFGDGTALTRSLTAALSQNPAPSKIYGIKVPTDDTAGWTAALEILSGVQDVTFVVLAESPIKTLAAGAVDKVALLKTHCEENSDNGQPRIGVAAIDPTIARSASYGADVVTLINAYTSDKGRMVVVAARGAQYDGGAPADVAAAAAGAIAARAPETSIVLKLVSGFKIPLQAKYTPGEVKALSNALIIPIIDPILISGESLHFAEGTSLSTNAALKYVDIVRLLDDMDFTLKASLVGLVGDARITRSGLNTVRRQIEAVLDGYVGRQAITSYQILIDILPILDKAESSWTPAEQLQVKNARAERLVNATVVVVIGPAMHCLVINLLPTFAAAA
ncbi:hypothetical protein E4Q23_19425 [Candidatus Accumulibacter phosphatis]|jgi:hypothetical protein|uniref:Phage tail protein n=1 Tax=Candidatus Accumulibacter phosphatis TaxID=327160 RepID=A0ABX1TZX5_9PROT|nr:hypothetical protein [Candidatus Accumulibacter phosphatis]NMQ29745.1 hypothetical protein [Candidatus Accumulibacter phosphatis]